MAKPGTGAGGDLTAVAAGLCAAGGAADVADAALDAERAAGDADLAAYEGRPIAAVTLVGAPTLAVPLTAELVLAPGETLTRAVVGDQLRRLWRVGLIEDASARVTGVDARGAVSLELRVRERGRLRAVTIERRGAVAERSLRRLRSLAGVIDDPTRALRTAARLRDDLRSAGHWKAAVAVRRRRVAAAPGTPAALELCVGIATGPRYVIGAVEFPGATALAPAVLAALVAENEGTINAVGGAYRADLLDTDLVQIQGAYFDAGHVLVQVGRPRVTVDERRARITLAIPVDEGERFRVGAIEITGVDAARAARYRALFGIEPGAEFSRAAIQAGVERISAEEQRAGHSGVVVPMTSFELEAHRIRLIVEVAP